MEISHDYLQESLSWLRENEDPEVVAEIEGLLSFKPELFLYIVVMVRQNQQLKEDLTALELKVTEGMPLPKFKVKGKKEVDYETMGQVYAVTWDIDTLQLVSRIDDVQAFNLEFPEFVEAYRTKFYEEVVPALWEDTAQSLAESLPNTKYIH